MVNPEGKERPAYRLLAMLKSMRVPLYPVVVLSYIRGVSLSKSGCGSATVAAVKLKLDSDKLFKALFRVKFGRWS